MAPRVNPARVAAIALALLLSAAIATVQAAGDATLRLRAVFEHDPSQHARAVIDLGSDRLELSGRALELSLPAGTYPLALVTPGVTLVSDASVALAPGDSVDLELRLRLDLELHAPASVPVQADGRAAWYVTLVTAYPYSLPVELAASAAAGVRHHGASALRGVIRAGVSPRLEFVASIDADAEPLHLRIEPYGLSARIDWLQPTLAVPTAAQPAPVPEPQTAPAQGVAVELSTSAAVVLPGDSVRLSARVHNAGSAASSYTLRWTLPEWLEAADALDAVAVIAAGEAREHHLDAVVRFGGPISSHALASVSVAGGATSASASLRREQLQLRWLEPRASAQLGSDHVSWVEVDNPTDRTLAVRSALVVDGAIAPSGATAASWTVPPGSSQHQIAWRAASLGAGRIELTLVGERDTLAHRLEASIDVTTLGAPARRTHLALPITLTHPVPELIVHVPLPPHVEFVSGSARLDGAPLPEASIDAAGGLWWRFPAQHASTYRLSVELSHERALGPLPEVAIAARIGEQLHPIVGVIDSLALPGGMPNATSVAAAATSDGMAPANPRLVLADARSTDLRIVEPAPGALMRPDEAVRVVIEARAGERVDVRLNGEPLPRSHLGLHEIDAAVGLQRLAYYGLPLREGENQLRVETDGATLVQNVYVAQRASRLEVRPLQTSADGVTPIVIEVRTLDPRGVANGFGPVRVVSDRPLLDADAFPELAGQHALIRDGVAILRFPPSASAAPLELTLHYDTLSTSERIALEVEPRLLWNAQGSAGVSLGADGIRLNATAQGYLEASGDYGNLQVAIDGAASWDAASGLRYLPGFDTTTSERYPTTGTDASGSLPLRSDDGLALRYVGANLSLDYLAAPIAVPGVSQRADGSAARASLALDEHNRLEVIAGLLPREQLLQRIVPDGTRRYALDAVPRSGSERVTLEVLRDGVVIERIRLRPGNDYVIDRHAPALQLARALWQRDLAGNELRLEISYTPLDAPRDVLALGAGWVYADGPWSFDAGVARLPYADGSDLSVGAGLGYSAAGFTLDAALERRASESANRFRVDARYAGDDVRLWSALELGVSQRLHLEGRVRLAQLGVSVAGTLRAERDLPLAANATLSAQLSEALRVELEHALRGDAHSTGLRLASHLAALDLDLAAGLRYRWGESAWDAVAAATYSADGVRLALEHVQPLTLGAASSSLDLRAPVLDASARARIEHVWGGATSGVLGIEQRFGTSVDAGLELRLPGGGAAAVASAALSAPVRLSDTLQLDLQAGLERPLTADGDLQAAFSAGLRYRDDTLDAGAAADIAYRDGAAKLVLQADAQWRPNPAHTLALDAGAQLLDDPNGRLSVSYAFHGRDLTLLSYHQASFDPDWTLQGEVAAAARLNDLLSLRSAAAYRYEHADADAFAVQHAHGLTLYSEQGVSLGAVAYHALQPLLERHAFAFGAEFGYALVPGANLVLGYTIGDGPGLLAGGSPGMHVRVDVFGGVR